MKDRVNFPVSRVIASLVAVVVVVVFGLAVLMVVERYNAAVITSVVTGTSLAAAELVRRLQVPASSSGDRDRTPKARL